MSFNRDKMLEAIDDAVEVLVPPELYMVTPAEMAKRWGCSPKTARQRMQANPKLQSRMARLGSSRGIVFWMPEWEDAYGQGKDPNKVDF